MAKYETAPKNRIGRFYCNIHYNRFANTSKIKLLEKQLKDCLNQELNEWLEAALNKIDSGLLEKLLKKNISIKQLIIQLPPISYSAHQPDSWVHQFKQHLHQQFIRALISQLQIRQNTPAEIKLNQVSSQQNKQKNTQAEFNIDNIEKKTWNTGGTLYQENNITHTDSAKPTELSVCQNVKGDIHPESKVSSKNNIYSQNNTHIENYTCCKPEQLLTWLDELNRLDGYQRQQSLNAMLSLWIQQPERANQWFTILSKHPTAVDQWCRLLSNKQALIVFRLAAPHLYPMVKQFISILKPLYQKWVDEYLCYSEANGAEVSHSQNKCTQAKPLSLWKLFLQQQLVSYCAIERQSILITQAFTKQMRWVFGILRQKKVDISYLYAMLLVNWSTSRSFKEKSIYWNYLKQWVVAIQGVAAIQDYRLVDLSASISMDAISNQGQKDTKTALTEHYPSQAALAVIHQHTLQHLDFGPLTNSRRGKKQRGYIRQDQESENEKKGESQLSNDEFANKLVKWLWFQQLYNHWFKKAQLFNQQKQTNNLVSDNTSKNAISAIKAKSSIEERKTGGSQEVRGSQNKAVKENTEQINNNIINDQSRLFKSSLLIDSDQLNAIINKLSVAQLQQLFDTIDVPNKWDIYHQVFNDCYGKQANSSGISISALNDDKEIKEDQQQATSLVSENAFWQRLFAALNNPKSVEKACFPTQPDHSQQNSSDNHNDGLSESNIAEMLQQAMYAELQQLIANIGDDANRSDDDIIKAWHHWLNAYCLLLNRQLPQSLRYKIQKQFTPGYEDLAVNPKATSPKPLNPLITEKTALTEVDRRNLVYLVLPQIASWLLLHHDMAVELLIQPLLAEKQALITAQQVEQLKRQLTSMSVDSILSGKTLSQSLALFFNQAECIIQRWQQQHGLPLAEQTTEQIAEKTAEQVKKQVDELKTAHHLENAIGYDFITASQTNGQPAFSRQSLIRKLGLQVTTTLPRFLKNYFASQTSLGYVNVADDIGEKNKIDSPYFIPGTVLSEANKTVDELTNSRKNKAVSQPLAVRDDELSEALAIFQRAILAQYHQLAYQNNTRLLYHFLLQNAPTQLSHCLQQTMTEPAALNYLLAILPMTLKNSVVLLLRPNDGYLLLSFIHWLVVTFKELVKTEHSVTVDINTRRAISDLIAKWESGEKRGNKEEHNSQCWRQWVIQYWIIPKRHLQVERDIPQLLTLLLPGINQQAKTSLQHSLQNQWRHSPKSVKLQLTRKQNKRKQANKKTTVTEKLDVSQLNQQAIIKILHQLGNNSWQENVKLMASLTSQDCFNFLLQLRPFDGLAIYEEAVKLTQDISQEYADTDYAKHRNTTGLDCEVWALLWCAISKQISYAEHIPNLVSQGNPDSDFTVQAFDRDYFRKACRQLCSHQTVPDKQIIDNTRDYIQDQPLVIIKQLLSGLLPIQQLQYQQINFLTDQVLAGDINVLVDCLKEALKDGLKGRFQENTDWLLNWLPLMTDSQWQLLVMRVRPVDGISIQTYSEALLDTFRRWLSIALNKQLDQKRQLKLLQRAKQLTRHWLMTTYLQTEQTLELLSLATSWFTHLAPLYDEITHAGSRSNQITQAAEKTVFNGAVSMLKGSAMLFAQALLELPDECVTSNRRQAAPINDPLLDKKYSELEKNHADVIDAGHLKGWSRPLLVWRQLKSFFLSTEDLFAQWLKDVDTQQQMLIHQQLAQAPHTKKVNAENLDIATLDVEQMLKQPEVWMSQPAALIQQQLADYLTNDINVEYVAHALTMEWFALLTLQLRPSEHLSLLAYTALTVDCVLCEAKGLQEEATEYKSDNKATYWLKWLVLTQWLKPQQPFSYPQSLIQAYRTLVEKFGLVTNIPALTKFDQAPQQHGPNNKFWRYRFGQQLSLTLNEIRLTKNRGRLFSDYIEVSEQPALIAGLRQACFDSKQLDNTAKQGNRLIAPHHDITTMLNKAEPIRVDNAGLVIITCYLERLFNQLNWQQGGVFNNAICAEQAAALLQYMACSDWQQPEHVLTLNKILCGIPLDEPLSETVNLTEKDCALAESLLKAVISHWRVLGNTTVEGLQTSFLQRIGWLIFKQKQWQLSVEVKAYDMLLDQLPWSIKTHKLPWMEYPIMVNWRDKQ
ncbi:contractile injection system tape measure protein [Spartinivicinus poritis]|uniref:Contractile injection system tape measure protein n=1 Tax=Spartinivicinus poritis TaxID=2994640 RepID=A0ABT5U2T8_9GAMM|nr:contractile injection system tape measure protein [Spartinivicinus sp. A2-2]MDE1460676.1 contractile injection system tape measure protein [Spartinivicinus sp. A2-2]